MKISTVLEYLKQEKIPFQFHGEQQAEFSGFSDLKAVEDFKMVWVRNLLPSIAEFLNVRKGLLIVCGTDQWSDFLSPTNHYILVSEPRNVFFSILNALFVSKDRRSTVGEGAVIRSGAIGTECMIGINSYIAEQVKIGNLVEVGSNVSINENVTIGDYCKIASGAVIGADGFGFYRDRDGFNCKIPHFGGVIIGDHVEVGANACIDRGTLGDTVIGDYTKIDNLVHIAHNVHVGRNCMIVAGAIICGSSTIGDNTYIAPGVIIRDQVKVGRNCFIGMGTIVTKDIAPDSVMLGVPARKIADRT